MIKNDEHYDHITDAWQCIMGNNFHFGYFQDPQMSMNEAGNALIDKMLGMIQVTEASKILDVGCGIGGPALYIASKFNCSICGITNSKKGVAVARKKLNGDAQAARIEFLVADGTKNNLPNSSFDIVWVMESSHLMGKKALLKEGYRVLKPGGNLILCDLMYRYFKPFRNIFVSLMANRKFSRPKYVYGSSKVFSLMSYWKLMHNLGFNDIITVDISKETFPTMNHWKQSVLNKKDQILASNSYTSQEIKKFINSCHWLEMLFRQNTLGYAIIKGTKPESP